jgi:hypothetical protein
MPNWVDNNLTIYGTKEQIEKVKGQVSQTTTSWWENKKESEKPIFSFFNIISPPEDKLEEYEGVHGFKDGEKQGESAFNWYNFNNREWGTKWDVGVSDNQKYSETTISEISPTKISYHFQTAWSPPLPVIEALSLQNPEVEITLDYEEEQGWGGKIYWDSTGSSVLEEYDSPNSHADYVKRDNVDSCNCANSEDTDDWYDDCPGKKTTIELFAKRDVTQLT